MFSYMQISIGLVKIYMIVTESFYQKYFDNFYVTDSLYCMYLFG